MPQLKENQPSLVLKQDEANPHFLYDFRENLNLHACWIGLARNDN